MLQKRRAEMPGYFEDSFSTIAAYGLSLIHISDRILIEPSGVGKLSDVTRAVEGVAESLPVILNSFCLLYTSRCV